MKDKVGSRPVVDSLEDALKMIVHIAKDKRSHFLLSDHVSWLELKLKECATVARLGLRTQKTKDLSKTAQEKSPEQQRKVKIPDCDSCDVMSAQYLYRAS
jgi:hypothetical protein